MVNAKSDFLKEPSLKHPHRVKILMTEFVTHDVKRFILEKPDNFEFSPGQATTLLIPKPGWEKKDGLFTFTSLNKDKVLELTIKRYPSHHGITEQLHMMEPGDEVIIHEPFGTIHYEGKGVFLAGGAGITPFVGILRDLYETGQLKDNMLIFSNKETKDVILEKEFRQMLGDNLILTLTRENRDSYEHGRIDEAMLKKHLKDLNQKFYICGPDSFVIDLKKKLTEMGVSEENIIAESLILADA
ncbi:flavodoxin reductase [Candidatus Thorarchaeota archaeon]|nr:MAG: flavodoxin reductase [Candidatus Thorarchaeota archaeon]